MSPGELVVHTFILKLWREPAAGPAGAGGEWRGELQRVPGGTLAFFRTLEGLVAPIREALALPRNGGGGGVA